MKFVPLFLALLCAGCASAPTASFVETPVSLGMSRADLRSYFGEPRRIVEAPGGGEDWIYRFGMPAVDDAPRHARPREGEGLGLSRLLWNSTKTPVHDEPIHLSADGLVVPPLPAGLVLRR